MTTQPTNPWQASPHCPFTLVGLEIGMTVHVHLVHGPCKTGTLVAISPHAISVDDSLDRGYFPFAQIQALTWQRS